MAAINPIENYPLSHKKSLTAQYVGQRLQDLPTPALVLDRSKLKKNTAAMLQVCQKLDVGFRAHVKSHKTLELSMLQVGETGPANFIVSTVIEAENLSPFVVECQKKGRETSILYGVPVPQSAIPRLINLAKQLSPGSINVIIDNIDAFTRLEATLKGTFVKIGVFIKIDTGYHRAGIITSSPKFTPLVQAVTSSSSGPFFQGFYSHYGHSYAGNSQDDAAMGLIEEFLGLEAACAALPSSYIRKPILTVGATPTATAAQNMLSSSSSRVQEFHAILNRLKQKMLLEVSSVYTERSKPEVLVSAGSLALGRDPCKSYPGWGIVTGDFGNEGAEVYDEVGARTGWIVGRISQEHGILTWEGEREKCKELKVGDKVMVWPNHACVAGAGFGWYLVVDGEEDGGEKVVDVWTRWRGW
ncbi:hypothetical protein IQ06DRAFT_222350 [Phaeosphaeriaceae sp. SRC1lsM3a]|nr:hypothetical protein IQ06DRAFT_222350 [Stagonospora sp. SRC1lsM3a]